MFLLFKQRGGGLIYLSVEFNPLCHGCTLMSIFISLNIQPDHFLYQGLSSQRHRCTNMCTVYEQPSGCEYQSMWLKRLLVSHSQICICREALALQVLWYSKSLPGCCEFKSSLLLLCLPVFVLCCLFTMDWTRI